MQLILRFCFFLVLMLALTSPNMPLAEEGQMHKNHQQHESPIEMDHSEHAAHDQQGLSLSEQQSVAPEEWVTEKTGQFVPLEATFKDEKGKVITLAELVDRPTLLLPVYYFCPRACSFDQANLAEAIKKTSHPKGSFRVISMSFNEVEPPEAAAIAKPNYTELLGPDFPEDGWVFLTGDKENILRVTNAIGYTFKKQSDHLFIHPSALVALSSEGQIIKYIYGSFLHGDVDLALAEAEKGTPATSIRRFLSFCFNYSPKQNQTIFTILKLSTVTLLVAGFFYFVFFFLRKKK